ncbi:hypothetical protein C8A01DRAFT_20405 [Parachaetomium inaequale]|uniref:Uncharacterized protein n=1 Tax=Parachaetomium inaequale TaxID=2588326 RepID=A0AAN6P859_9PEZI|nr:hypothetical protein C8A01DRAFT_20405 [Parachaetomium inaequale]
MRFEIRLLGVLLWLHGAVAQTNQCPDTELACHDIMNSSQCISQVVLESNNATVSATKEAMIKCVEHEGTASNLPGAVKVSSTLFYKSPTFHGQCLDDGLGQFCRCPGCHTQPINDVIAKLFAPPCA